MSKVHLARYLGVSRQSLYYKPKRPAKDEVLRERILSVLDIHPAYGYRRIAEHLKRKDRISFNPKTILRVMRLYHIVPRILRRAKRPNISHVSPSVSVPNRMKDRCPIQPDAVWAGDFTEFFFLGRKMFLATIIDIFTREVIAWQVGYHHTAQLVIDVLTEAVRKRTRCPQLFHSDQGSEYTSQACLQFLAKHNFDPSWSPKGKPWNNGRQESFYVAVKWEFFKIYLSHFKTLEELLEGIGKFIHYYNADRMHSVLKMSPKEFCDLKRYRSSVNSVP